MFIRGSVERRNVSVPTFAGAVAVSLLQETSYETTLPTGPVAAVALAASVVATVAWLWYLLR